MARKRRIGNAFQHLPLGLKIICSFVMQPRLSKLGRYHFNAADLATSLPLHPPPHAFYLRNVGESFDCPPRHPASAELIKVLLLSDTWCSRASSFTPSINSLFLLLLCALASLARMVIIRDLALRFKFCKISVLLIFIMPYSNG
jgi:hypothetical protein